MYNVIPEVNGVMILVSLYDNDIDSVYLVLPEVW